MGLLGILAACAALGVVGLAIFVLYQIRRLEKRFKNNGVPYLGLGIFRVYKFFTGKISMVENEKMIYQEAKKTGKPIVGFCDNLVEGSYYITDLDLCRNIYVKDFDHFVDRRKFDTMNPDDLLNKMLISLESDHWKGLRSKLSPAFTTGKIRRMFNIFQNSSQNMCDYLEKTLGSIGGECDISEAYSKYTMDVIASCAFGIDSKSFECQVGQISEFEDMAKKFQVQFTPMVFFKFVLILVAPKLAKAVGIVALEPVPQMYFRRVVKQVLKHRRDTGERRDDFLQLMMDIQQGLFKDEENSKETLEVMTGSESNEGESKKHFQSNNAALSFDDDDIVANSVLFLIGGFDTTQSLLIFAAYSLALEQECQEKLRGLVREAMEKNDGKLTYETIHGMTYLDNFLNETLRCFSPAVRTERRCTKDYKVPGTDVVVEKGTIVALPISAFHRDSDFFENPEMFDPDRFLPENKGSRHPYAFSPFGQGPRNCIGMRFALTEVKAVIATLVHRFKLEPGKKTEIPVKFSSSSSLKPKNGMWLSLRPLNSGTEE